ncbi:hypothetical protein GMRT_12092 [Giardia muris]|uniref:Proteasome activator complex subunit 4 n=1 Tax=Giardia muris TaxID=5742 RepID=A0A4Z1SQ77_GIAMU|nr:hypothetical protein GMRT_12092 [Giardia muris]|eukprot:TNJ27045.1 hypothetical protein GMRT_12092 [Giardia muris]
MALPRNLLLSPLDLGSDGVNAVPWVLEQIRTSRDSGVLLGALIALREMAAGQVPFTVSERVELVELLLELLLYRTTSLPKELLAEIGRLTAVLCHALPSLPIVIPWRPLLALIENSVFSCSGGLVRPDLLAMELRQTLSSLALYFDPREYEDLFAAIAQHRPVAGETEKAYRYAYLIAYFVPYTSGSYARSLLVAQEPKLASGALERLLPDTCVAPDAAAAIEQHCGFIEATHTFFQALLNDILAVCSQVHHPAVAAPLLAGLGSLLSARPDLTLGTATPDIMRFVRIAFPAGYIIARPEQFTSEAAGPMDRAHPDWWPTFIDSDTSLLDWLVDYEPGSNLWALVRQEVAHARYKTLLGQETGTSLVLNRAYLADNPFYQLLCTDVYIACYQGMYKSKFDAELPLFFASANRARLLPDEWDQVSFRWRILKVVAAPVLVVAHAVIVEPLADILDDLGAPIVRWKLLQTKSGSFLLPHTECCMNRLMDAFLARSWDVCTRILRDAAQDNGAHGVSHTHALEVLELITDTLLDRWTDPSSEGFTIPEAIYFATHYISLDQKQHSVVALRFLACLLGSIPTISEEDLARSAPQGTLGDALETMVRALLQLARDAPAPPRLDMDAEPSANHFCIVQSGGDNAVITYIQQTLTSLVAALDGTFLHKRLFPILETTLDDEAVGSAHPRLNVGLGAFVAGIAGRIDADRFSDSLRDVVIRLLNILQGDRPGRERLAAAQGLAACVQHDPHVTGTERRALVVKFIEDYIAQSLSELCVLLENTPDGDVGSGDEFENTALGRSLSLLEGTSLILDALIGACTEAFIIDWRPIPPRTYKPVRWCVPTEDSIALAQRLVDTVLATLETLPPTRKLADIHVRLCDALSPYARNEAHVLSASVPLTSPTLSSLLQSVGVGIAALEPDDALTRIVPRPRLAVFGDPHSSTNASDFRVPLISTYTGCVGGMLMVSQELRRKTNKTTALFCPSPERARWLPDEPAPAYHLSLGATTIVKVLSRCLASLRGARGADRTINRALGVLQRLGHWKDTQNEGDIQCDVIRSCDTSQRRCPERITRLSLNLLAYSMYKVRQATAVEAVPGWLNDDVVSLVSMLLDIYLCGGKKISAHALVFLGELSHHAPQLATATFQLLCQISRGLAGQTGSSTVVLCRCAALLCSTTSLFGYWTGLLGFPLDIVYRELASVLEALARMDGIGLDSAFTYFSRVCKAYRVIPPLRTGAVPSTTVLVTDMPVRVLEQVPTEQSSAAARLVACIAADASRFLSEDFLCHTPNAHHCALFAWRLHSSALPPLPLTIDLFKELINLFKRNRSALMSQVIFGLPAVIAAYYPQGIRTERTFLAPIRLRRLLVAEASALIPQLLQMAMGAEEAKNKFVTKDYQRRVGRLWGGLVAIGGVDILRIILRAVLDILEREDDAHPALRQQEHLALSMAILFATRALLHYREDDVYRLLLPTLTRLVGAIFLRISEVTPYSFVIGYWTHAVHGAVVGFGSDLVSVYDSELAWIRQLITTREIGRQSSRQIAGRIALFGALLEGVTSCLPALASELATNVLASALDALEAGHPLGWSPIINGAMHIVLGTSLAVAAGTEGAAAVIRGLAQRMTGWLATHPNERSQPTREDVDFQHDADLYVSILRYISQSYSRLMCKVAGSDCLLTLTRVLDVDVMQKSAVDAAMIAWAYARSANPATIATELANVWEASHSTYGRTLLVAVAGIIATELLAFQSIGTPMVEDCVGLLLLAATRETRRVQLAAARSFTMFVLRLPEARARALIERVITLAKEKNTIQRVGCAMFLGSVSNCLVATLDSLAVVPVLFLARLVNSVHPAVREVTRHFFGQFWRRFERHPTWLTFLFGPEELEMLSESRHGAVYVT